MRHLGEDDQATHVRLDNLRLFELRRGGLGLPQSLKEIVNLALLHRAHLPKERRSACAIAATVPQGLKKRGTSGRPDNSTALTRAANGSERTVRLAFRRWRAFSISVNFSVE